MAWHTIKEAQELTGKSRRTLYRDMAAGRMSWSSEVDNSRRIETTELIRVYGELKPMAQASPEKTAHSGTVCGTQDVELVLSELKALREEVAELRSMLRLIEHKPVHDPADKPEVTSVPWWKKPFSTK